MVTATNSVTDVFHVEVSESVQSEKVYICRDGHEHHERLNKYGFDAGDMDKWLQHNCEHAGETLYPMGTVKNEDEEEFLEVMCSCTAHLYVARDLKGGAA